MQASAQYQQQLQRQQMLQAQTRALQAMAARQQALADPTTNGQQAGEYSHNEQEMHNNMSSPGPIEHQEHATIPPEPKPNGLMTFQAICQTRSPQEVERILSTTQPTAQILNFGLEAALTGSNIPVAQYLLSHHAPITPSTAEKILHTTNPTLTDRQIALFTLLSQHGWTPNSSGSTGAPLLPKVAASSTALLRWFLTHGANPNFGIQRLSTSAGATDQLSYESCAALESASAKGDLEAVQMLFDAGAEIRYGYPLHYAAGALPAPGSSVRPEVFDADRIPIMQLLIERGAAVNQKGETELVAHHPIMYAVMAGAVQRVRWLLERGADPEARGSWGSAVETAFVMGSEEMKAVMEVGIRARRFGGEASFAGEVLAIRPKPSIG
jgi:ankyrin repeat protein